NLGQAPVSGPAQVTLTVPAGFTVQESLVRSFTAGNVVTWSVTAPTISGPAVPFDCAITTTPIDVNAGAPALMSKASDTQSITVSSGGALASPVVSVKTPAGAVDATLSVGQTFTVQADVYAGDFTDGVQAVLTLPPGFSIVNGSLTRDLGNGPADKTTTFNLLAPTGAVSGAMMYVTFTAKDRNSGDPVAPAADTLLIAVVPRTSLAVAASVISPPDAIDNTVAIGTAFTISATVANAAGAADIEAPGSLQITLPQGYSLATGQPQQPFVVGTAVSWTVNAAAQPSGPDQITVSIVNIPADENSGSPAQVTVGAANIPMVTEGAAVAMRDVSSSQNVGRGVAPAGAKDLDVLAFEIAYNVSDPAASPAEVDTLSLTFLDKDGGMMGPGVVTQTLARIAIDLGGAQPYEVLNPSTNPVRISLMGGGTDRIIDPDGSVRAVVYLDLDPNPRATELRVRVAGGQVVRSAGQPLGVTDPLGQPLVGQVTSGPLVVLSSNFEEYAHNAPNPFRAGSAQTQISYFLDTASNVEIRIFDITGELVYEEKIASSDPRGQAGPQESPWDGRNMNGEVVRNGLYVCVLNAGSKSAKIRIAVAK
ncbi:MAG TPA: hypothetical protein VF247_10110, partial [Candidatus Krumholzibacteria bacterium]